MFIPPDVNMARMGTLSVVQVGAGAVSVACPAGRKLCVWFTWVAALDGAEPSANTQCLLKFGTRTVAKLADLGLTLFGQIGPLVGDQDEAVSIDNDTGPTASVVGTLTYVAVDPS